MARTGKWVPGTAFRRSAKTGGGRPIATARLSAGVMNSSEERYARDVLDPMIAAGELHEWLFEPVTFRLGHDARFTPDFLLVYPDGSLELVDFKGHQEEAALVRVKAAASRYPWFAWSIVNRRRRADGGGYQRKVVPAHHTLLALEVGT